MPLFWSQKSLTACLLAVSILLWTAQPLTALKCYACDSEADCFESGNLDNVRECENSYNACMVNKLKNGRFSKHCYRMEKQDVTQMEDAIEPGSTSYFCYSDLCNKGDYGTGRSGSASKQENGGSGLTSSKLVILASGIVGVFLGFK